jgi:adenylosuccinate synthase
MDKTGRNGLRVGDLESSDFQDRYDRLKNKHLEMLTRFDFDTSDLPAMEADFMKGVDMMRGLTLIDSEHFIHKALKDEKRILAEGAQGSLLDIDFGSYPFVRSSNTVCAGACSGLGIAPNKLGDVYGIFKAYCTRVGSGPFPTELHDDEGEELRKAGHEFGATTGRPRRCGWIDLPALKYAINLNGVTKLIMTKADVLSGFERIKVCTGYFYKGEEIDYLPYDIAGEEVTPIYKELKGWQSDLTGMSSVDQLPQALHDYITYLESELEVPITIVSVGPDRTQTLMRNA